jgi:hypothetical protein
VGTSIGIGIETYTQMYNFKKEKCSEEIEKEINKLFIFEQSF